MDRVKKVKNDFIDKLFITEGGKRIINRKFAFYIVTFVFPVLVITYFIADLLSYKDTSHLSQSAKPIKSSNESEENKEQRVKSDIVITGKDDQLRAIDKRSHRTHYKPKEINFKASQVISRSEKDTKNGIPIGSNFIGKLISSIDTRDSGTMIKVLLPYGGKSKTGYRVPQDTILLGQVSYSGQGEKVFLKFNRGITPDGIEFDLEAQALNSKDYSSGIMGELHRNTGTRVATSLGLTAISTATGILTRKVPAGQFGTTVPEATMKNAMYGAVSKVTEEEAKRQAQEITAEQPYVTVESGQDLIISLTKSLKGNIFEH